MRILGALTTPLYPERTTPQKKGSIVGIGRTGDRVARKSIRVPLKARYPNRIHIENGSCAIYMRLQISPVV